MLTIDDISSYFLALSDPDSGEGITNLKLQKLCYYAQGFYLAMNGKPLFSEDIEAWQHGPVIPSLYHKYKGGVDKAIKPPHLNLVKYPADIRSFLEEVYEVYGQFSAWKLRDMTHHEKPWIEAYANSSNTVISHHSMKEYFKTLLTEKK